MVLSFNIRVFTKRQDMSEEKSRGLSLQKSRLQRAWIVTEVDENQTY
jgi:hypothetical protein